MEEQAKEVLLYLQDLTVEGWYWIVDTTTEDALWSVVYICQDIDSPDANWVFGEDPDMALMDVESYHVMVGPLKEPDVEVPIMEPTPQKDAVGVPALVKVEPTVSSLTRVKNKSFKDISD